MDVVSIGSALLVYGPLGILAAVGLYWKYQADGRQKDHEATTAAASKAAADALQKQHDGHQAALQTIVVEHRAEVRQLTDRFVELVETYAEHYRTLLDKVSSLADALTRTRSR